MTPAPINWSEKRAAPRKQFSARGLLRMPDGRSIELRTFDASALGVGIEHDDVLPSGTKGVIALGLLNAQGMPVVFQAEAEVRHTLLSGGRWRSGVQFTNVSAANRQLLDRVLRARLSLVEGSST